MSRFALVVLFALFCAAANGAEVSNGEFPNYHSIGDDWEGTCATGKEQSPINVVTKRVQKLSNPELKAEIKTLGTVKGLKIYLTDVLHTVKVTWKEFTVEPEVFVPAASKNGATFVPFDPNAEEMAAGAGVTKVPIEAIQFHFHTPSEEAVDGRRAAAVVHIVHQVKPGFSEKCDKEGGCLVVLGVLMDLWEDHEDDNPVLAPFLSTVYNKSGEANAVEMEEDFEFNLDSLLPKNLDYRTFPGSLTTPPCTEGVLWVLFKDSTTISQNQVHNHQLSVSFADGDDCEEIRDGKCFPPRQQINNRPLQPLNGRVIREVTY